MGGVDDLFAVNLQHSTEEDGLIVDCLVVCHYYSVKLVLNGSCLLILAL